MRPPTGMAPRDAPMARQAAGDASHLRARPRERRWSGGFVGYLDQADGDSYWRPPQVERKLLKLQNERLESEDLQGSARLASRAPLPTMLEHRRSVTAGTFVCSSTSIPLPPSPEVWLTAAEHRWDLVPVVIQDPTWEQSFPDVHGIVVPLRDSDTGRVVSARLTAKEAAARREANADRLARLLDGFRDLGLDAVLISSDERFEQLTAFSVLCRASACQAGPPGDEIVRSSRPCLVLVVVVGLSALAVVVAWEGKRGEDRRPGQPTVPVQEPAATAPAEVELPVIR